MAALEHPQTQQRWELRTGENVIGRAEDAVVRLDNYSLGKRHAVVRRTGELWHVEDLRSTGGTWWSAGEKWERLRGPQQLRAGDRLRVGTAELVFVE